VSIVSRHLAAARRRIRVCYALVAIENILGILWPVAIGLAIDGLLRDSWVGSSVFVALSLAHTGLSFARQRYESRTFNRLYADLAADLVEQQREADVAAASVAGRTALTGEYVEFLQSDIPLAITSAFTVVGSLAMLFVYDVVVGVAAALVALPVMLVNRRLMRRSQGLFEELNDLAEAEVDVIRRGRRTESRRFFGIVSGRWIHLSDAEAASWSIVEIIAVGLWMVALVRATSGTVEVGAIIATIAYVWSYTAGFEEVPGVLQRLTRLPDITRRLDDATDPGIDSSDAP
jgi:hypothetical protein